MGRGISKIGGGSSTAPNASGEATFTRGTVPVLKAMRSGGVTEYTIQDGQGYSFEVDGVTAFLQRSESGTYWNLNVAGILAGDGYNTLKQAKANAVQDLKNIMKNADAKNSFLEATEIANEIKRRGGTVTSQQYSAIRRAVASRRR